MTLTLPEYKKLVARKKSKYGNKRVEFDGQRFDSMKEYRRWKELNILLKRGEIRNLKRQVPFVICFGNEKVCVYKSDFQYERKERHYWVDVVEDVKGYRTEIYRLKKKMMKIVYGIEILET